jgi:uncharacterized protein (TIGR03118 family)
MNRRFRFSNFFCAVAFCMAAAASALAQNNFVQHNLVSDIPGLADFTDPNLKNPWGIASSPTSPFWVSDNGVDKATLYNTSGTPQALVVTIPPAGSGPTGVVFNGTNDFQVAPGAAARFLFATEAGTIAGWNAGTTAVTMVDSGAAGAVYKGIALGNNGVQNLLYGANFTQGRIDTFGPSFAPVTPGFIDPGLPSGYGPFNVQNLGGSLFVTYALLGAGGDDVPGAGHGFVDVFDTNGVLLRRLISQGVLDSPWGLAIAPATFGDFANTLLVGNFGDGTINSFNPTTGNFLGTLRDSSGDPIVIDGLWGLRLGNVGSGGDPNTLYFAAGINDEVDGLFGSVAPATATATVPDGGSSALLFGMSTTGLLFVSAVLRSRLASPPIQD